MPKALAKLGPALRVASLRTGRRTGPMANTQSGRVHGAAALPVRSDRERFGRSQHLPLTRVVGKRRGTDERALEIRQELGCLPLEPESS
jgi:hypothetical protein